MRLDSPEKSNDPHFQGSIRTDICGTGTGRAVLHIRWRTGYFYWFFFLLAFWCGSVRSQEVVAKARRVLFLYFEPDWLPPWAQHHTHTDTKWTKTRRAELPNHRPASVVVADGTLVEPRDMLTHTHTHLATRWIVVLLIGDSFSADERVETWKKTTTTLRDRLSSKRLHSDDRQFIEDRRERRWTGSTEKNKKKRKEKEVERRKRNFAVCFPFFGVFDRTGGGAAGPPTGLGRAAESKIKF